jgi:hypothetical protein
MNETIRNHLATRFRWSYALVIAGGLITLSHRYVRLPPTIFAQDSLEVTYAVGAMLLAMGAIASLRIKCPKCQSASIGNRELLGLPFLAGHRVNNCTYCGVNFDEPMSQDPVAPIS